MVEELPAPKGLSRPKEVEKLKLSLSNEIWKSLVHSRCSANIS